MPQPKRPKSLPRSTTRERHDSSKQLYHGLPSPAVTRITVGSSTDYTPDSFAEPSLNASFTRTIDSSASSEDVSPPQDGGALDELWDSIRKKKEKKLLKERPKVKSLQTPPALFEKLPTPEPSEEKEDGMPTKPDAGSSLPRQKSVTSFRESADGRNVIAAINVNGIPKENIHVSFQRHRLVITWGSLEVAEWEDDEGRITREIREKSFQRTFPLPQGTRFEEIKCAMNGKNHLLVQYPNSRSLRVEYADAPSKAETDTRS